MSYLIPSDYKQSIQDANLQQIIANDNSILLRAQLAAQEEAASYLVQKYDISQEFTDTKAWSNLVAYKAKARVYNTNNVIYSAPTPYPEFDYGSTYNVNDLVFWKDHTYECLIQTPLLDHDTGLQYRTIQGLPLANIAPDDITNGSVYWKDLGAYTIPAGTDLTNTTYWSAIDNRGQAMVLRLVDLTLYHIHSRIAPRNIPDLRVKRYDEAIEWLKGCAKGDITPNLPILKPKQGGRIRYGGDVRNINTY